MTNRVSSETVPDPSFCTSVISFVFQKVVVWPCSWWLWLWAPARGQTRWLQLGWGSKGSRASRRSTTGALALTLTLKCWTRKPLPLCTELCTLWTPAQNVLWRTEGEMSVVWTYRPRANMWNVELRFSLQCYFTLETEKTERCGKGICLVCQCNHCIAIATARNPWYWWIPKVFSISYCVYKW